MQRSMPRPHRSWHWSPRMQGKVKRWKNMCQDVWYQPFSKEWEIPVCVFKWTEESMNRVEKKLENISLYDQLACEKNFSHDKNEEVDITLRILQLNSLYMEWREDVFECLAAIISYSDISSSRTYRRQYSRFNRLRIGSSFFSRIILESAWNLVENPRQEAVVVDDSLHDAAVHLCHAFSYARHALRQKSNTTKYIGNALKQLDICYIHFEQKYVNLSAEREANFDKLLNFTLSRALQRNVFNEEQLELLDPAVIVVVPRLAVIQYCFDPGNNQGRCPGNAPFLNETTYQHCLLGSSKFCTIEILSQLNLKLEQLNKNSIRVLMTSIIEGNEIPSPIKTRSAKLEIENEDKENHYNDRNRNHTSELSITTTNTVPAKIQLSPHPKPHPNNVNILPTPPIATLQQTSTNTTVTSSIITSVTTATSSLSPVLSYSTSSSLLPSLVSFSSSIPTSTTETNTTATTATTTVSTSGPTLILTKKEKGLQNKKRRPLRRQEKAERKEEEEEEEEDQSLLIKEIFLSVCQIADSMLQGRQSPYTLSLQRVLPRFLK